MARTWGHHNGDVSNFAAVFALTDEGWMGAEADLAEVMTIEDIADLMREAAVEVGSDLVLLLVADDDRWFGVVRITGEGEPRVFLSDVRAAIGPDRPAGDGGDRIAALLYGHLEQGASAGTPGGAAAGDSELLDDLGTDATTLVRLTVRSAPDALFAVAQRAGLRDEYARLR